MNIVEITTYKEGGIYTHVSELTKRANGTHRRRNIASSNRSPSTDAVAPPILKPFLLKR